jgi:glutathione S-transferase
LILIFFFARHVDFFQQEHMSTAFKAINPTSTVPALVDGNVKVFDSSAIAIYMVEKYAKDDALYPKDLVLRTKVNERLFYVSSYIFPRIYQIFVPGYHGLELEIPQKKLDEMQRGYQTIETFLEENVYLAGDFLSIADLSLWTNMESLHQIIQIDEEKLPNFTRWMEKMRELPTYAVNKEGADGHIGFYRQCVEKAKATANNSEKP